MRETSEERLEEALRMWEDHCLHAELGAWIALKTGISPPPKPLKHYRQWRTFRRTLLDRTVTHLNYKDWLPDLSGRIFDDTRDSFVPFRQFPSEFFGWTRWSRKVLVIEDEDQRQFESATMADIRWKNIVWPFFSFAVELARPIRIETTKGELLLSHALVTRFGAEEDEKHQSIFIRMLSQEGHVPFFMSNERKCILRAMEHDDLEAAGDAIDHSIGRSGEVFDMQGQSTFSIFNSRCDSIEDLVRFDEEGVQWRRSHQGRHALNASVPISDELAETVGRIVRIIVWFCISLNELGSSPRVQWTRRKSGRKYVGSLGIMTRETDVCRILGRGVIDQGKYPSTVRNLKGKGFVRPHWRREHYKRPPYTSPDHPKTIRVPAKLINENLVPYFGILAGSITRVLSDE